MKLPQKPSLGTEMCNKLSNSLVSGIWFLWFLSPEAGGTLRPVPGEPSGAAASKGLLSYCIRTL